jgi:hypothetical protein
MDDEGTIVKHWGQFDAMDNVGSLCSPNLIVGIFEVQTQNPA